MKIERNEDAMAALITTNPFTQEITGTFEFDTFEQVQSKVHNLVKSQKTWAQMSVKDRLEKVKPALIYFDKNREQIAKDICEQMGRPLHHSRGELRGFFERAEYLCSIAEAALAPDILNDKPGFERSIEHVPLGVIFVISAWNFPLLITVNSVVPALIAGNTILLKHSSLTPLIGRHFENAFGQLGGLQVLSQTIIDHEVTGRVIDDLPINHLVFTGSVSGGKSILKHTSKKFMMPALELGGKDAAYIHRDADIQHAVDTVVDGAMFNAGQSCCGMERAYVHKDVYDDFVARAKKLIESYKIGDPKDESTSLGPLAQAKSAAEMREQVVRAEKAGAKVLVGGHSQVIGQGTFFQATLLTNVKNDMAIMQEENFGPILPVMSVSGLEEAIQMNNDSVYGLTAAIFTKDISVAKEFARQANVGTVFMNRCDYLDPALPWTGVKDSGVGSALSKYGFYGLTRRKGLHFKTKL
jgi:acyl-CoA reductase-like NAD-dependent aldehyde dehydrogenase